MTGPEPDYRVLHAEAREREAALAGRLDRALAVLSKLLPEVHPCGCPHRCLWHQIVRHLQADHDCGSRHLQRIEFADGWILRCTVCSRLCEYLDG